MSTIVIFMTQLDQIVVGLERAARFCDISLASMRRHCESGHIAYHRQGSGNYLFGVSELEEFAKLRKAFFWGKPGKARKTEVIKP